MKRSSASATSRRVEARRFASFLATGGAAAGINLGSRWALSHLMVYEAAVAVAYLIGMVSAFLLARVYVFKPAGGDWGGELGRFALVNAGSFLVVLGVSSALARVVLPGIGWRWRAEDVAHAIGVLSPVVLSYYAHKRFSFRGEPA